MWDYGLKRLEARSQVSQSTLREDEPHPPHPQEVTVTSRGRVKGKGPESFRAREEKLAS